MKVTKLQEFCTSNGVTGISKVRTNTNGYPFLTFLSSKFEGGAENIYFSKNSSKTVAEGAEPKSLGLAKFYVANTTNEAGEPRLKLTNNSEYSSVEELF